MTPEICKLVFDLRHKPPVGEPITSEHLVYAAEIIETLHRERNEARRLYCESRGNLFGSTFASAEKAARYEAKQRNWDCYVEINE